MEQGGPDEEAKAIEEAESVGCIGVSRRGGPPLIGYTLLRLFRNITWSKGLRILHRLATPVYQHHRPSGTPLYFSDGKVVRCCATFCKYVPQGPPPLFPSHIGSTGLFSSTDILLINL